MTTATLPQLTKRVEYDRLSRQYAAFVVFEDGTENLVGYAETQHDASLLASDSIISYYNDHHTPEKAAELVHQELTEEGRHAELARDMGATWESDPEAVTVVEPELPLTMDTISAGMLVIVNDESAHNPGGYGRIVARSPKRGLVRVDSGEFPGQEVTGWYPVEHLTLYTPAPAPTAGPFPVCPIPCAELHQLATTDRRGFAAALAALSESELTHEAAVYAAFLAILGDRQATAEATLAHFRNAIALHCSGAVQTAPSGDAICCTLYELALTNIPALAELLRAHTDIQRQQLAWRYAAWLRRKRGIDRTPAFILRGWDTLLVGMAASGIGGIALERAAEQTAG